MQKFRLYFLDHGGHVFGIDEMRAKDDEAAIQIARAIFKSGIGAGYDIWNNDRHVHLEMNDAELVLN